VTQRPSRRRRACINEPARLDDILGLKLNVTGASKRGEAIEFNAEGFGGTDFRPAFEHVDREQLNPACLIYLTDADGIYPDEPPMYPTLWAITIPNRQAPLGETVRVDVTGS
jgi:predicted metal-dependent peptidase